MSLVVAALLAAAMAGVDTPTEPQLPRLANRSECRYRPPDPACVVETPSSSQPLERTAHGERESS